LELGDAPGITLDVRKVRRIMYDYQNFKPYFLENSIWMWSNKKDYTGFRWAVFRSRTP